MRTARALLLGLLATATAVPAADAPYSRLSQEALKPSSIGTNLQRLTDEIGGRISGTPAMERAVHWAVDAFHVAGADDVHTEAFTLPGSWAEGATEMTVVEPVSFRVSAVSLAWAPALASQHHVRVVPVGRGTPEEFAHAGDIARSVLLVEQGEMKAWKDLDEEYDVAFGIIDRALQGKALAIAFQSTRPNGLLYRHTNTVAAEMDRIPMVLIGREDASRMVRLAASGKTLYADLSIPNEISGPVQTANVVAEIRGREKPEEFVVLSAHLDSWELGTGALDNGCNAALVIDTLRTIKASRSQPRRSIRFILFSGEEEGLYGSRSYVASHRAELDNIVALVNFDNGVGRLTGFSLGGRKDLVSPVSSLLAPLPELKGIRLSTDGQGDADSDNFDFMLAGIPALNASNEEDNYLINYHASSDTFDKVDLPRLKKQVAEAAVLTFAIADSPQRIGPRLHRAQIEQNLRHNKLDESLKEAGMWDDWEKGRRGRTD